MLVGKECEGCKDFNNEDTCYARWVGSGGKCFDEITPLGKRPNLPPPTINPFGNCEGCVGEPDDILCKLRKAANTKSGCYLRGIGSKPKETEEIMSRDPKASDQQVGGSHYKDYEISPYLFLLKNKIPHHKAAIIRRILRYDHPTGHGIVDLNKCKHEIDLIIEYDGLEEKGG